MVARNTLVMRKLTMRASLAFLRAVSSTRLVAVSISSRMSAAATPAKLAWKVISPLLDCDMVIWPGASPAVAATRPPSYDCRDWAVEVLEDMVEATSAITRGQDRISGRGRWKTRT